MEVNLFSYLQRASAVYNVNKGAIRDKGELREELEELEKALNELAKNLRGKRARGANAEKARKESKRILESIGSRKEEIEALKSLEVALPDRIFEEWDSFAENLGKILSQKQLEREHLDKIQELARKAGEFRRRFEKAYYVEYVAGAARDSAESITRACRRLLNEVESAYKELGYSVVYLEAKLVERGLFGASQSFGKLLFEVALEFDPYLNAPFIPGSSIKGAFRSVYDVIRKPGWPQTSEVFGSADPEVGAGDLVFTDAYPVKPGLEGMILYPDIVNPHYSGESGDVPEEYGWEPVPNPYLTVAPGTTFGFLIASKRGKLSQDKLSEVMKVVFEVGLGGKTCIGYGRFNLQVSAARGELVKG